MAFSTANTAPLFLRSRAARAVCVLAVFGLAGGGWYLHLQAAPNIAIPPPVPLPAPNAYDDLVRIGSHLAEPPDSSQKPTATDSERQAALAKVEPDLNELRAALAAHEYREPPQRGIGKFDPAITKFRSFARTLSFESKMRERAGDYGGAANSAIDAIQLGVTMPKGGGEIARLVGYAVEAIGYYRLLPLIDHLSAARALSAAQQLESIVAKRTPLGDTLTEEKWIILTDLREQVTRKTTFGVYGDIRKELDPQLNEGSDDNVGLPPKEAEEMRAQNRQDWRELLTHSKQDIVDGEFRVLDAEIANARLPVGASHSPLPEVHDPVTRYSLLLSARRFKELMDATHRLNESFAIAILALHAWKLQHGSAPDSLDALVKDHLLHTLPEDPFAASFSTPLHYRRLDAAHFLLYSVGPDAVDDSGRPVQAEWAPGQPRLTPTDGDKGDWVFGVNGVQSARKP